MAGLSVAAAVYFFGPSQGLALILVIAIHEFGHVAAFRICGHDDARFRLVPLMGGVAISNRAPDGPMEDFFISLMGPAICLAPTLLALAVVYAGIDMPDIARTFIWHFGIWSATLNFLNLLPIGPLDGGKISRVLFSRFFPKLERPFNIFTIVLAMAVAAYLQWYIVMVLTALYLPQLARQQTYIKVRKLTGGQGALMLACYFFTTITFLIAGLPLIRAYL